MNVLLIAQYFWPESVGAGVWIHQLAIDLTQKGHRVTVLTSFPNYPEGRVFAGYRNRIWAREDLDRIQVNRAYLYPATGNAFCPRPASFASFCASALCARLLASPPD